MDEQIDGRTEFKNRNTTRSELLSQIRQVYSDGGYILTCGNGGSATQANHLAQELIGRYNIERPPIKCLSLCSDPSIMSCISNDFGFGEVFARQAQAFADPKNILLCFTTSGCSQNIIRAIEVAESASMRAALITGKRKASTSSYSEAIIYRVAETCTRKIQEEHLVLIHDIVEDIEKCLFGFDYQKNGRGYTGEGR